MNPSIKDILAPLAPHWDRIIRRPMSRKEVDVLQKQVGLPVPAPFRDYLMEVGLFQDLTCWGASSIQMYERPAEFVSARQFLSKILPATKADLFPFGGDGAGNEFCLPSGANVPCRIHFVDHETGKVSKQKDFTVWLQGVVAKVLRGMRRRVPNDRKVWAVQFTFRGTSYPDLAKVLRSAGRLKEIDRDWMNPDTEAGVTSSERRIELNGQRVKLRRLECAAWDGPMHSFDMREPLLHGLEHSQIRALDRLFKEKCPGYRLVDYGPLDSSQIETE